MNPANTFTSVGLRIDVDTFRGTRDGVPQLIATLEECNIHASIFFSIGPDNMGRHLWRLLKPQFLVKMLRSKAASLYGWDIVLRGTLWPGPEIGKHLPEVIRSAERHGHEIGLHAWDHHRWQAKVDSMSREDMAHDIQLGLNALSKLLHKPVNCSAVAGWKCNENVLLEKSHYPLRYNSDCRGKSIFRPEINHKLYAPQIPVTLPTYDEVVGMNNIDDDNYNEYLLNLINPGQLNVLTIHAEVEGIAKNNLFRAFLRQAHARNIRFCPLGELLPDENSIPPGKIINEALTGREGQVCWQANA